MVTKGKTISSCDEPHFENKSNISDTYRISVVMELYDR